jgi:hypothetical protein
MSRHKTAGLTVALRSILVAGVLFGNSGITTDASASPVTYTIFAVTDVSLGGHFYHNAQVYFKFSGDTSDIQSFNVTSPDGGQASGSEITKGEASLLIMSGGHHIKAKFLPNQIMISLDGDNGGVGFGSLTGPNGLEPAYPLAIVTYTPNDLVTSAAYSGDAWSCIGFPPDVSDGGTGYCSDPTAFPLKTDRGDFFIYQPYLFYEDGSFEPVGTLDGYEGSINNGIFSVLGQ